LIYPKRDGSRKDTSTSEEFNHGLLKISYVGRGSMLVCKPLHIRDKEVFDDRSMFLSRLTLHSHSRLSIILYYFYHA